MYTQVLCCVLDFLKQIGERVLMVGYRYNICPQLRRVSRVEHDCMSLDRRLGMHDSRHSVQSIYSVHFCRRRMQFSITHCDVRKATIQLKAGIPKVTPTDI